MGHPLIIGINQFQNPPITIGTYTYKRNYNDSLNYNDYIK